MINKKLVSDFANIIGNIEIGIQLDTFHSVKENCELILKKLLKWIKYYYDNKNFDIVTTEESLEIHALLEEIKWNLIADKEIDIESLLTDDILIRYEVIIKTINDEKEKKMAEKEHTSVINKKEKNRDGFERCH